MSSPYLDQLIQANPKLLVRDKHIVEEKLKNIIHGGFANLKFVVDFDGTLTRHHKNGSLVDCTWGVMENSSFLPDQFKSESRGLRAKYVPIEVNPDLSIEDKIPYMVEWYDLSNQLLQKSKINKSMFKDSVDKSNIEFRDGTFELFEIVNAKNIPMVILSAGLGDILVEVLHKFSQNYPNIMVLSNFLIFDDKGFVSGVDGEIIHVYNKKAVDKNQDVERNIILMGDSLGDISMASKPALKIGFVNELKGTRTNLKRLQSFLDAYDIVLVDDQSMSVPIEILKQI